MPKALTAWLSAIALAALLAAVGPNLGPDDTESAQATAASLQDAQRSLAADAHREAQEAKL